ncbi:MAG: hypothetical protein IJU44_05820 [Kiritimatiellae bacterium]|nr:hypothetical protein [Kiritimatiellia bacterium]
MNKSMFAAVVVVALSFTGCVSYKGIAEKGDDLVDEANQPYASAAQTAFEARVKAPPRPVVINEAPGLNQFLAPTAAGHPLCRNLDVRKELVLAFKGQLREKVAGIKDFKLLDENTPMVEVVAEGDAAPPQNYLMTYNIISIELRENAGGSLATGLAGGKVAAQKFWDAIAKVEVRLFKPNGTDCIFSFTGDGLYRKMVDENNPLTKDLLLGAVKDAVDKAMAGYAEKFGPPIFVTDTCQNGRFARLSVGSKFGVQAAQKVEFFFNKVRKGVSGEDEVARQVVGSGVIGGGKAPVEDDGAWVKVDDYNADKRTVLRWTSARILPVEKKK